MKKVLLIILVVLTLFIITGCTNNRVGEKTPYNIKDDQVTIKIKEDTLTPSQATFIIANEADKEFTYGEPYHLEIKHENAWHILELEPDKELFFTMPAYSLKANETVEKTYNWEYGYGKLEKGKYRLVITVSLEKEQQYIAGEFEIK